MARSSAYPSYTISYCLDFIKKVYQEYGSSSFATRKNLADVLGISEGAIQMRTSSAVQYGLLEMKSGEGYKPSQLFLKIHKPLNEEEKHLANLEALKSPKLYSQLIADLENHLIPSTNALGNILFRKFNIAEKVSQKAAKVFIDNINYLNLKNEDNKLKLDASSDQSTETVEAEDILKNENEVPKQSTYENSNEKSRAGNIQTEYRELELPLTGKKKSKLIIPIDINEKDLDIIKAQIEVIRLSIE